MNDAYPRRGSHYAHRLTRLLFKSCAAQDLGHHAVLLIIHIAHTEDAARYQGPVRFWNSQLMETLGFSSPKQLNQARKRAVDAGWLRYERVGTRTVGRYWTMVPSRAANFDDAPIEDNAILSSGGTNNGKDQAPILSPGGTISGMNPGMNPGKLSNPIPTPSPARAAHAYCSASDEQTTEPEPAAGFKPFPCSKNGTTWTLNSSATDLIDLPRRTKATI